VIKKRAPWRTVDKLELATARWVEWWNHRRLLRPVGDVLPAELVAAFVHGAGSRTAISDDLEAVRAADPSTYASIDSPAFFLLHGSNDRQVSPSQTLLLHEALRVAGADTCRWMLKDADHGDMPLLGPPTCTTGRPRP
jgi:hypothetical protein